MNAQTPVPKKKLLLQLACWLLATVLILRAIVPPRPPDPNAHLARAAEEAISMARDAQGEAFRARRRAQVLRALALGLGATVPMVVAYLIYRAGLRSGPDAADYLRIARREDLEGMLEVALMRWRPGSGSFCPRAAMRIAERPGRGAASRPPARSSSHGGFLFFAVGQPPTR